MTKPENIGKNTQKMDKHVKKLLKKGKISKKKQNFGELKKRHKTNRKTQENETKSLIKTEILQEMSLKKIWFGQNLEILKKIEKTRKKKRKNR